MDRKIDWNHGRPVFDALVDTANKMRSSGKYTPLDFMVALTRLLVLVEREVEDMEPARALELRRWVKRLVKVMVDEDSIVDTPVVIH